MRYREEVRRIFRSEGLHGFSVGYKPMLIRDLMSFGFYFLFYDILKRVFQLDQVTN